MTMFNKKSLALAVSAAVLGMGFSGAALAVFNIDSPDTVLYAAEHVVDDSNGQLPNNDKTSGYPLDLTVKLGAREVLNMQYYIRFEFEGATINGSSIHFRARNFRMDGTNDPPVAPNTTCTEVSYVDAAVPVPSDPALCDYAELNSGSGRGGQNFAVYHLKAAAERVSTDPVYLLMNQLTADNTQSNVTGNTPLRVVNKNGVKIKYGLYDKQAQAFDGGTAGQVIYKEAELLNFKEPSFQFLADRGAIASSADGAATSPEVMIDVASDSTKFNDGGTMVELGRLSLRDSCGSDTTDPSTVVPYTASPLCYPANNGPDNLPNTGDEVPATSANILLMNGERINQTPQIDIFKSDGNTVLRVEGDFAAAKTGGKVFYVKYADAGPAGIKGCSTGAQTPATSVTDTAAEWKIGNVALDRIGICMEVNGTVAINGGAYTATLIPEVRDVTGTMKFQVDNVPPVTLGTLRRNGTVLQTPFFNLVDGYKSRFYLTNTGKVPAKVTIETGSDGTLTQSSMKDAVIPASSSLFFTGDQLVTGGQRGYVVFNVQAPSDNIEGLFQLRNVMTGDYDSHVMIKK